MINMLFLVFLAACASDAPTASIQIEPTRTPAATISAEQQKIQALWRRGPHSKVLLRPDEVNNTCAHCHSPGEWDPSLVAEKISDCAASVIETSQKTGGSAMINTSLKSNEPTVDLTGWHAVDCKICHRPLENGEYSSEVSYWNQETGKYEEVVNNDELCKKCHRKSEGIDNSVDLGSGMHANLGCTDCHEPHRATASCANSACHTKVAEDLKIIDKLAVLPGHETGSPHSCGEAGCHGTATQIAQDKSLPHIGIEHGNVTCSSCHDATGKEVAPIGDSLGWNTWQQVTWDGKEGKRPYFSHNVQRTVNCTRCHYQDNPWHLSIQEIK